jgi:hypothetical protein
MPFESQAQRAKFYILKKQGKMTQAEIDKWDAETPKNIPKHGKKKKSPWKYTGK